MSSRQLVQEKWDAAERTRRLLPALPPQSEDRERLLAYARQLDAEADELERQMMAAERPRQPKTQTPMRMRPKSENSDDDESKF
jgi:hypothetical protein